MQQTFSKQVLKASSYRSLQKCHLNHRNTTLTTRFNFTLENFAAFAAFYDFMV